MILDENLNLTPTITKRERQVLLGLSKGFTSKQIGERLRLSEETVKWYRKSLRSKLNAKNSFQLALFSIRDGFLIS